MLKAGRGARGGKLGDERVKKARDGRVRSRGRALGGGFADGERQQGKSKGGDTKVKKG